MGKFTEPVSITHQISACTAGTHAIADKWSRHVHLQLFATSIIIVLVATSIPAVDAEEITEPLEVTAVVPREFPPQYTTDRLGRASGFAIEVMEQVAILADLQVTFIVKESWAEVMAVAVSGEADLIPNMGVTADRAELFDFSSPMETYPVSVFVRADTYDISSVEDLVGHDVAVVKSNIAVLMLQSKGGVRLKVLASGREALIELLSGHVDAFVFPKPNILTLAKEIDVEHHIKVVGTPLVEIKRAIAVPKGNEALLRRLDRALQTFLKTEKYQDLYVHWHKAPEAGWTIHIRWVGASLLVMFLVMLFWRYFSLSRLYQRLVSSIEAREKAEHTLHKSEARLRTILETIIDGIIAINNKGIIKSVNPAAEHIFGYPAAEMIGQNVSMLTSETHRDRHDSYLENYLHTGESDFIGQIREGRGCRKDGTLFPVEIAISESPMSNEHRFVAIVRDVTERKQAEEKIMHLAMTDPLTGLANRHRFNSRLDDALHMARRMGYPVAVMILDLDRFKQINDTQGHLIGDEVLKRVADILTAVFRDVDTVARWGGDEFAVILNGLDNIENESIPAQRIINELSQPIVIEGNELLTGISIGISLFPDDGANPIELIRKADLALFRAKKEGRCTFRIYSSAVDVG